MLLSLFSVGNCVYATSTKTQDEEYYHPGRDHWVHNLRYSVAQEHLGTSKDASGVITAKYKGIHSVADPVLPNLSGGSRKIEFYSFNSNDFNNYNIVYDSRVPIDWHNSYIRYERDFYLYDMAGNVLYQKLGDAYRDHDFTDYMPIDFIGDQPYVGYENDSDDSYSYGSDGTWAWGHWDTTDYDHIFDALLNGGVRIETYETVSMYVIDENSVDRATSIVAEDSQWGGRSNTYNSVIQFEYSVVPEPSSSALLGISAVCLMLRRKR